MERCIHAPVMMIVSDYSKNTVNVNRGDEIIIHITGDRYGDFYLHTYQPRFEIGEQVIVHLENYEYGVNENSNNYYVALEELGKYKIVDNKAHNENYANGTSVNSILKEALDDIIDDPAEYHTNSTDPDFEPFLIDTHEVKNNTGYYSTLSNVRIIDSDTVEITFNNESKFGLWVNGTKVWGIPGEFETVRQINVGQRFITHCVVLDEGFSGINPKGDFVGNLPTEDIVGIDHFELKEISILRGVVVFEHYVYLSGDMVLCNSR